MSLGYTIRESCKAKYVSLRVAWSGQLEVVVPRGFDQSRVPAILAQKQDWIDRVLARTCPLPGSLPSEIALLALAETWRVEWQPTDRAAGPLKIQALEQPDRTLVVRGDIDQPGTGGEVLRRWVGYKARLHLVPWLAAMSHTLGLPYDRVLVRQQKTIWGSCSARKTISLNGKLLFLPPALVRYVLIHELCHTVQLNHSAAFWALVAQHEPNYRLHDRHLREARQRVPLWMERDG